MKQTEGKSEGRTIDQLSRREFIMSSAAASTVALAGTAFAYPGGSDKIRVGLVGCGGRGMGAARNCIESAPNVELYAMGDLFEDYLRQSFQILKKGGERKGKPQKPMAEGFNVTRERCFSGFDSYKKVIETEVDLVLFATPPQFRPLHLRAAIEGGKHAFVEKPCAVDPAGVRSVIESGKLAEKKGLAILAGTQRRHTDGYLEVMKRIHDGAIGELVGAQCYWVTGDGVNKRVLPRKPEWSDMEYQIRNWYFYTWLSGDHIVEQHVHNLDVVNWAMNSTPVKCMGMGGRQVRTGEEYGHIFDHFAIEYEYPNGARVTSLSRQISGCANRVGERIVGTKGHATPADKIEGENPYEFNRDQVAGQVQEHTDLIASIREGNPLNEAQHVAEATMTAIMGRMSAYTGREISWKWAMQGSQLDLTPPKYEWAELAATPVAVPGQTELV